MKVSKMAGTERDFSVVPETDFEESCLIEKYGDPGSEYIFIGKLEKQESGKLVFSLHESHDLEDRKTKIAQERKDL